MMSIDEVSETIGPATTILAGKPNSPLQFRSVEVDVAEIELSILLGKNRSRASTENRAARG